jgi:hypothetical protein
MVGKLRAADGLILPEVRHTIGQLALQPEDSAAATLAEQYARAIDQATCSACGATGDRLDQLGPKLLAVLESLGATPRARAAAGKTRGGGTGGKLAAVRAAARPA